MDEWSNSITTNTVILIFVVILVIALMAAWVISPSDFDGTRWKVFLMTLSSVSFLITITILYSAVEIQQKEQELVVNEQVCNLEKNVRDIVSVRMPECSSVDPEFVLSMSYPYKERVHNAPSSSKGEKVIARQALSSEIFGTWQTTVVTMRVTHAHKMGYITRYLQWAHSRQLKKEWKLRRCGYSDDTKVFVDLLFKHTPSCRNPTTSDFENAELEMIECEEYMSLF